MNIIPIAALVSGTGWEAALLLFFAMIIGHAIADYPMQGAFLAKAKDRYSDSGQLFGESHPPKGLWIHALTAHSLVHAGAIWLITGSPLLAAIETLLHWFIDFAKCEGWTSFTIDQLLHIVCKAIYAIILSFGIMTVT